MGRTGRRDLPPEMWFVMREEEPEPRTMMPETIPWKLLQGYRARTTLSRRKVGRARARSTPHSLLYHQTMSTLASTGEAHAGRTCQRVLTLSYSTVVSRQTITACCCVTSLRSTISRSPKVVGSSWVSRASASSTTFKFYAVFQENEGVHRSQRVGRVGHDRQSPTAR